MPLFESRLVTASPAYRDNRHHMVGQIEQLHLLQERAALESAKAGPRFAKRGQLLPRERLALLVDAGAPFLELAALAGYLVGEVDPEKSVPGAGLIAGIGYISRTRCMIVVADSGIDAGALQPLRSTTNCPSCISWNRPGQTCCSTASKSSSMVAGIFISWRCYRLQVFQC